MPVSFAKHDVHDGRAKDSSAQKVARGCAAFFLVQNAPGDRQEALLPPCLGMNSSLVRVCEEDRGKGTLYVTSRPPSPPSHGHD